MIKLSLGPHYRHMTTEDRQKILKSQYCFTCKCKACTLPELQYFIVSTKIIFDF